MNLATMLLAGINFCVLLDPWPWVRQADTYAEQKDYERAASIYRLLITLGYASGSLYYNLGVCSLAYNDIAEAIYYFRKACEQEPWRWAYLEALQLARSYVPDRPPALPLRGRISLFMRRLELVLWWCGWLAALAAHFRSGKKIAIAGLFLVAISLLAFAVEQYWYQQEELTPWAVVRERCVMRSGNGESYPPVMHDGKPVILYPGTEIFVLGERDNSWVCISVPGTITGWLPKRLLLLASEPIRWQ
jgi:tetratricopeptide (TPR) repeat protein